MKVLIVEDSPFFRKLMTEYIKKFVLFAEVKSVDSFSELKNINLNDFDLCIADYVLIDAEGEHIDYLIENNQKVIVLTKFKISEINIKHKDKIIDYISKEQPKALDYLVRFIKRFYKNRCSTVLVVDYEKETRDFQKNILESINLNVLTATNGKEALDIIDSNPDIDLIIMDYEMQILYAERFVIEVRNRKASDELPILVVVKKKDELEFINLFKLEVNDFIIKPFLREEFVVRVNNLLEMYDKVKKISFELQTDPLTKVYNRYFLEHHLESIFNLYSVKSMAMIDIDDFKKINDTYGHIVGDEILHHFATTIKNSIRKSDFVIRYGGEEFLIFMPNTTKMEAYVVLNKIKNNLKPFENISYTFSAGISDEGDEMAEMINIADKRLYKAKKNGKNLIVFK